MRRSDRIHKLDSLFIVLIFSVFAVVSLLLVAIGAGMYQRVVDHLQTNNEVRSSLSYIAGKIRSNDSEGAISIRTMNSVEVLCLKQPSGSFEVTDYIYYYGGELKEQSLFDGTEFKPENGETIVAVTSFDAERHGNLFTFTVVDRSGRENSISIASRCS